MPEVFLLLQNPCAFWNSQSGATVACIESSSLTFPVPSCSWNFPGDPTSPVACLKWWLFSLSNYLYSKLGKWPLSFSLLLPELPPTILPQLPQYLLRWYLLSLCDSESWSLSLPRSLRILTMPLAITACFIMSISNIPISDHHHFQVTLFSTLMPGTLCHTKVQCCNYSTFSCPSLLLCSQFLKNSTDNYHSSLAYTLKRASLASQLHSFG